MGSLPVDLSASRGASILGLNAWTTPVEEWLRIMEERTPGFCEKNEYEKPPPVEGAPLRWGTAFEGAIRHKAEFFADMAIPEDTLEAAFSCPEAPFVTCHLDGIYEDGETNHEGKTTSAFYFRDNFGEPGSDRLPKTYQVQVQHQMLASQLPRTILSVLVFPDRVDNYEEAGCDLEMVETFVWAGVLAQMGNFHQYHVDADLELQRMMLVAYRDFWEVHVLGETPPVPEKYSDVVKLVTAPKGTIVADARIERLSAEYKSINEESRSIAKRKDQLKTLLLDYMRTNAEVSIDDDSVEKWILRDKSGKKLHQFNGKQFR